MLQELGRTSYGDEDASQHDDNTFGVSVEELVTAMADVGNNWERAPLRASEGREGWEDSLVGCLKDVSAGCQHSSDSYTYLFQHANLTNFPRLREVLTRLLFAPDPSAEQSTASSSSRTSTPVPSLTIPSTPGERYHDIPPSDKITILAFMCNLAISSKAIHAHMESCEEQLTALRKEKIEVNRQKKQ
jgi:bromodomain adjacent to zinc finger domain protein 1A